MSETPRAPDDNAALRAAIDALASRLDRIEAQDAQPSALSDVQTRLRQAWHALRGDSRTTAGTKQAAPPGSLFRTVIAICAVLLALILLIEVADEVFDGLWHLGAWVE